MAHWSDKYVGAPYIAGVADCAALAREVSVREYGLHVVLPQDRAAGLRAGSEQIDAMRDDYAVRLDTPVEGCMVLMRCRGLLSHVGVYCEIAGQPWVLHAMKNAGQVVRHRLTDLPRLALAVEGYYAWK